MAKPMEEQECLKILQQNRMYPERNKSATFDFRVKTIKGRKIYPRKPGLKLIRRLDYLENYCGYAVHY